MKPTKRQIKIVEHFVNRTTKKIMNEAFYDPDSKEYKLKFLQDSFDALLDYANNKEGNLKPDFIIKMCKGIIALMEKYKSANKG